MINTLLLFMYLLCISLNSVFFQHGSQNLTTAELTRMKNATLWFPPLRQRVCVDERKTGLSFVRCASRQQVAADMHDICKVLPLSVCLSMRFGRLHHWLMHQCQCACARTPERVQFSVITRHANLSNMASHYIWILNHFFGLSCSVGISCNYFLIILKDKCS